MLQTFPTALLSQFPWATCCVTSYRTAYSQTPCISSNASVHMNSPTQRRAISYTSVCWVSSGSSLMSSFLSIDTQVLICCFLLISWNYRKISPRAFMAVKSWSGNFPWLRDHTRPLSLSCPQPSLSSLSISLSCPDSLSLFLSFSRRLYLSNASVPIYLSIYLIYLSIYLSI